MDVFREVQDPSGRVVVREIDDRGESFPIVQSAPANVRGLDVFQEVFRTESMARARRGQITFNIDTILTDSFGGFLMVEVNVVGFVGGASEVLQYCTIDPNQLAEFRWEEPQSYSAIALEARQNVNGVNTSDTTGITQLRLNISGRYWR